MTVSPIPHSTGSAEISAAKRLIAFYLPQYHPIPENNHWWGTGFTEWTNVTRARPLFRGHYQPHLPAHLGFYDLRVSDVRERQAELAAAHGLHGFCYYHYWFSGQRLLERPFDEVLASGRPNFPFCLCWANESWTRRWDGQEQEILILQRYDEEDDRRHIRALLSAFEDRRYLRVDGKPVFLVYRASKLPNASITTEIWRSEAQRHGLGELYLVKVDTAGEEGIEPASLGFDAAVEFQPAWLSLPWMEGRGRIRTLLRQLGFPPTAFQQHLIFSYPLVVERMLQRPRPAYLQFPGVTPMWDNSARRREGAHIFNGSTPELYENWLRTVLERFVPPTPQENLVFVNAWNEWAEGNHLEPDQRWGLAYLEATKRAAERFVDTAVRTRAAIEPAPSTVASVRA